MKLFSALTVIGLALVLTLALAGCGSSGGGGGGGSPAANPAAEGEDAVGSTTTNPVGEPGPEGAFACYMTHKAPEGEVTTCAETAAELIPQEEAKKICESMSSPSVNVVWNGRGCSKQNHVGTCIGAVPQGGIEIKVRYYNLSEEVARSNCTQQNPQNQFTTEY